ncbi:SMI1/KNR4 family protein [Streptomyces qinzhouensis]|uniref:SMI1/KNR4 family protein n=1 Tax=Streptomyces qinzhouensis TaxID=2599401 RepID=A0A5B8JA59_9ACTN|nr:SMI1/KNR4 family protein [Streptomyces qinzhouensis]QDY77314.1 SMI1/KNR4 family protein [Streptomyces qinzhouensis]
MDMVAGVRGAIADRAGAWDFIRAYAAEWSAAPLGAGDGCGAEEIAAAEERLGLRLPAALKEAYALLGRRPDLTDNHDVLRPLAELELDEAGEALVFRDENQGACRWGIPLAEAGLDDPPVVIRPDLLDKAEERWEPWLGRVSHCFVEIVLAESVHVPEELSAFLDGTAADEVEAAGGFVRLPFPDYPPGDTEPTRWYAGPDALVRSEGVSYLRARTEEALDRTLDLFLGPEEED